MYDVESIWPTCIQQVQAQGGLHGFEYISHSLHDELDNCFHEVYASSKEHLFLSLDTNKEALHLWGSYLKKVILIMEKVGEPFLAMQDDQLSWEQLSHKYSASKATTLLTVIPGQYPLIPLPTISFFSSLIDEVAKYPKSIQTVSLLHWILIFST